MEISRAEERRQLKKMKKKVKDLTVEEFKAIIDGSAGDIYSQIVFSDGSFMLLEPGHAPEVFLAGTEQDIEVIGNVFENAELLEVMA